MNENQYLITQIQNYVSTKEHKHERKSFWCSDSEKMLFDIYQEWIGTPPTNPIEAEKLMMFTVGKKVELALVENLQEAGLAKKFENDDQLRVDMVRSEVPITGYIDCVLINGDPVEIKSFYGVAQFAEISKGNPKPSYLKQLAMYMDFLNKEKGKLVYVDRGTGQMFEFTLIREGQSKYKCMNVDFDLKELYDRWHEFYINNIKPSIEPKPDYRYKIPVEEIDWGKVSKTDISKARTGKKVIGDHPWAVQYSVYKDLIIEKEGCGLGYSDSEIAKIKELTKGYLKKEERSNIY